MPTPPSERACTLLSAITVRAANPGHIEWSASPIRIFTGAFFGIVCTIGSETSTATRHRDANTPTARWSQRVQFADAEYVVMTAAVATMVFPVKGTAKDNVCSSTGAVDMLVVHVAGVGREVLVHSELTKDRAVPYHFLLDSLHGAKGVRCASLLPVITVCPRVRQLTARGQRSGGELRTQARRILGRRRHVMSAGCQRVRLTSLPTVPT